MRGVPNVAGMVERVRAALPDPEARRELEEELARAGAAEQYQTAFTVADELGGADLVNRIVREAVLEARLPGAPPLTPTDGDGSPVHWHIPRGTRALGELAAKHPECVGGPILTTNFDPLISVAHELAGGPTSYARVVLNNDGGLGGASDHHAGVKLVHLHGYWNGNSTRHAPRHLTAARPMLGASLRTLLREKVVLVAAYGGWEDAFMRALWEVLDGESSVEVLWTFYSSEADARQHQSALMSRLDRYPRVSRYYNIDAHQLFEDMLAQASGGSARGGGSAASPGRSGAAQPGPAQSETSAKSGGELVELLADDGLRTAMFDDQPDEGAAKFAAAIRDMDNLFMLTWRFNKAMTFLAGRPGTAERAEALKRIYEQAAVRLVESRVEPIGEDGFHTIPLVSNARAEPPMAAACGRGKLAFWPLEGGDELRPVYGVDTARAQASGMDFAERAAEAGAEMLDEEETVLGRALGDITTSFEFNRPGVSAKAEVEEIASLLRTYSKSFVGEGEKSDFYTVVTRAEDPAMHMFGEMLKDKIPRLRVIYSVQAKPEQSERDELAALRALYRAYEAIIGRENG